jgi:hypothetical protein
MNVTKYTDLPCVEAPDVLEAQDYDIHRPAVLWLNHVATQVAGRGTVDLHSSHSECK